MLASHFSHVTNSDSSFINDGLAMKSDPASSSLTNDSSSRCPQTQQQYYDAAARQFNGGPPYDPYDPSRAAPHPPGRQASPWDLTLGQEQRQYLQQLLVSAGLDGLASTTFSREPIYTAPLLSNSNPISPARQGNLQDNASFQPDALSSLTLAGQKQLRNIAMPAHFQYNSPKSASSPDSTTGETKMEAFSSPDPDEMSPKASRKRKYSANPKEDDEDQGYQPVKKTAHNIIDKRYRINLNDKFAVLRDSVPSLRVTSRNGRDEDTTEDRGELHGLAPAQNLNKGTVLSKAAEYIRHLEKRIDRLVDENSAMQARNAAFEKLFMAGTMNGTIGPL